MKDNELDEINDLVDQLKETKKLGNFIANNIPPPDTTKDPVVTEDTINDFILNTASKLIQQGLDSAEFVKTQALGSGSAEEIEAYAKLITSVASAIDTLNKVNIQNKKAKASKEIKQMELDNSKNLLDKYEVKNQTNNILIATRDEIMKQLIEVATKEEEPAIDVDYDVIGEKNPSPEK